MSKKAPPSPPKRPSRAAPSPAEPPPIGTSEHMTPAALPQDFTTGKRVFLQLGLMCPDPNNPRKFRDDAKFKELCASVKAEGVLQNIVVRPVMAIRPGDAPYMIICGERRWRAAQVAELPGIDVLIRDVNDQEALSIGLVENVDREDMSPIDEGLGYKRLVEEFQQSVEEVAARVGKSTSYIRRRILVAGLLPEALEQVREQRLTLGGAEELSRVSPEIQRKYLEHLAEQSKLYWRDSVEGAPEVRKFVRSVMQVIVLENTPFDLADDSLPGGACTRCPKNTAQQRDLFAEPAGAGTCLDRPCFRAKEAAHLAAQAKQARATGAVVVEGEEVLRYFTEGGYLKFNSPMIRLDAVCEEDPAYRDALDKHLEGATDQDEPEPPTYRALLGDYLKKNPQAITYLVPPLMLDSPHRKQMEGLLPCIPRAKLPELLRQAGHDKIAAVVQEEMEESEDPQGTLEPSGESSAERHKADLAKRQIEQKASARAFDSAMVKLGDFLTGLAIELPAKEEKQLAAVLRELVMKEWTRKGSEAARRRQLGDDPPKYQHDERRMTCDPRIEDYDAKELLAFYLELVIEHETANSYVGPRIKRALNSIDGIDLDEMTKTEIKALRADAKKKVDKKPKAKGSKAAS